ncbi:MAG: DUF4837 family protein [Bacteroidota bacterium]
MKKLLVSLSVLTLIASSCINQQAEKVTEYLRNAGGAPGEIILVMDSIKWNGALGSVVKEVFSGDVPGLPQDEPWFTIHQVNPENLNGMLRQSRNLIFVSTYEGNRRGDRIIRSYYTENSLNRIKNEPDLFMFTDHDEFAKGQNVLHLFSQNDALLIDRITEHREQLRGYFDEQERKHLQRKFLKAKERKGLSENLMAKHGFSIRVPFTYQVADERDDFIWLRSFGMNVKQSNIIISWQDYESQQDFDLEQLLAWRDDLGRAYVWGDDSDSYLKTETLVTPSEKAIDFKNRYAKEIRGIWKLNDNSMGGAFISYAVLDEASNRVYYLEGFVYNPAGQKRELLREVESVLWTFKTAKKKEVI